MRRFRPMPAAAFAVVAFGAPVALAQPRPAAPAAYSAVLTGPDPAPGLGVLLPVRIVDARSGAAATQVRVSAVRLVSPFGAEAPAQPPSGPEADGVRLFRADLPAPGAWTLAFTLTGPTGPATRASVGFTVATLAQRPLPVDAAAPSVAAAGPSMTPLGPAVTAPGPPAPDLSHTASLPR